jgi:hypothetical protein
MWVYLISKEKKVMALDHVKLCEYFGVPEGTRVIDEFPSEYQARVDILDHEGRRKRIPMPLFSLSIKRAGGTLAWDCAIAKQGTAQQHPLLVGSRTAYTKYHLEGEDVIAKVAHTGYSIVVMNDKERTLRKKAVVYFYPLTPGRTVRGLAEGRGRRGPRSPDAKPRAKPHRRNMEKALDAACAAMTH